MFDYPFFILLNLAVGGDFPGDPDGSTVFPQQLVVDYVQVTGSAGGCDDADMTPWNLLVLDNALRASWAVDTCSPDDLARADWQPGNPAWGHCDITALVVNDIFGGDLMVGEVRLDGEQHGFHWWNRLPSGVELDLTREQFQLGQTVTAARVVERPQGTPLRRNAEYLLLRERLVKQLGPLPGPASMAGADGGRPPGPM